MSCVLVSSPFKARIVTLMEGRYAAEKDAEVTGEGGGGRRRSDGSEVGILGIVLRYQWEKMGKIQQFESRFSYFKR